MPLVAVLGPGAVQDDGNKLRISLLCANDQRIESNGGIAGLASDYIGTVLIRPVFLDLLLPGEIPWPSGFFLLGGSS